MVKQTHDATDLSAIAEMLDHALELLDRAGLSRIAIDVANAAEAVRLEMTRDLKN